MPTGSNPGGSRRKKPYKNIRDAPRSVRKDARRAGSKATRTKGVGIAAAATVLSGGLAAPVLGGMIGHKYGVGMRKSMNKAGYAAGGQIRREARASRKAGKRKGGGTRGRQRRDRNGKFA